MNSLFELDHVFLCTTKPEIAVESLVLSGLQVGAKESHPGQGTANTVFFFDNAYFELLWAVAEHKTKNKQIKELNLWERTHSKGCPFGIAFRFHNSESSKTIPFETWGYEAPWLPPDAVIPILTPKNRPKQPLLLISLVAQRPADLPLENRPPLNQIGKSRQITHITIYTPKPNKIPDGAKILLKSGVFTWSSSKDYFMELELDSRREGKTNNFRPNLPLAIKW